MTSKTLKSGIHYDLVLSDGPVTEQFSRHSLVFQVVDKTYGTISSECVNYAQGVTLLEGMDEYHEGLLSGAIDAESPFAGGDEDIH